MHKRNRRGLELVVILMHGIIVLLFNTQVLLLVKMQAVAWLAETPPRIYTSP